jgi:hypothetical protein
LAALAERHLPGERAAEVIEEWRAITASAPAAATG